MRIFWIAVSRVNGGTGGRVSLEDVIGAFVGCRSGFVAVAVAERPLYEYAVAPAPELEADRRQRADDAETEVAVQRDRAGIAAVADDREHLPPRPRFAARDQFAQQRGAHALAAESV